MPCIGQLNWRYLKDMESKFPYFRSHFILIFKGWRVNLTRTHKLETLGRKFNGCLSRNRIDEADEKWLNMLQSLATRSSFPFFFFHCFGKMMGTWKVTALWDLVHLLGGMLLLPLMSFIFLYHLWCFACRIKLRCASHLIKTSKGLLEYRWYGSGPVILYLHG